jgi:serine/threonine-protein kinase
MSESALKQPTYRRIGRYALFDEIGTGGMSSVHLGRLIGDIGFSRVVAIKRLHAHLAREPHFVAALIDEARVMSRIRHPNVASISDAFLAEGELFVVIEYISGETLARLWRRAAERGGLESALASSIVCELLDGLHAAHTAKRENGESLGVVHRDVSPQNVLVGADGVTRILDFGIAKASGRLQLTSPGTIKGKLAYMAPEQVLSQEVDGRADVYSAAAVLWECLTGRRVYEGSKPTAALTLDHTVPPPSQWAPGISPKLERVVMRGLEKHPDQRWPTAAEFAVALEDAAGRLPSRHVRSWVLEHVGESIEQRAREVTEVERVVVPSDQPGERAPSVELTMGGSSPAAVQARARTDGQTRTWSIALLIAAAISSLMFLVLRSSSSADEREVTRPPAAAVEASEIVSSSSRAVDRSRTTPVSPAISKGAPRRASPSRAAQHRKECAVPYWIDAEGIRRLKPQCL